jgi:RNA-directed DNA polymerase
LLSNISASAKVLIAQIEERWQDILQVIFSIKTGKISSNNYVLIKGNRSPYDGDQKYWGTRLGRHPELPKRQAILLKQQHGKCAWCGLYFREQDVMEVDHKTPLTKGGEDKWNNLQLLYRHCHDEKTAIDGSQKSALDKRKTH